jgi:pyruvate formate lyase activating enzyme
VSDSLTASGAAASGGGAESSAAEGRPGLTGRIYDIQGFSVHDGPGIRTTVFLKGCPLRCLWCHSPESQQFQREMNWMEMRCIGVDACGLCIEQCPKGGITAGPPVKAPGRDADMRLVVFDRSMCDNCGSCGEVCASRAVYLCGTDYTVDEVVQRVLKDRAFYERSGGGVTISGGEPLSQPEFVLAVLQECKKAGLDTAVDTTGHVRWEILERVLPFTDLFLYDLKHMDPAAHKELTGVSNERILDNARRIAGAGGKLQVRIPVIPGMNDSVENVDTAGRFCAELGAAVTVVQLLPYHRLGSAKYKRLQKDDPMPPTDPPSSEEMDEHVARLEAMGLPVVVH